MRRQKHKGVALLNKLAVMVLLGTLTTIFVATLSRTRAHIQAERRRLHALNLAEAGLAKATCELAKSRGSYAGEKRTPFGEGAFSVAISPARGQDLTYRVSCTGVCPHDRRGTRHAVSATVVLKTDSSGRLALSRLTDWHDTGLPRRR